MRNPLHILSKAILTKHFEIRFRLAEPRSKGVHSLSARCARDWRSSGTRPCPPEAETRVKLLPDAAAGLDGLQEPEMGVDGIPPRRAACPRCLREVEVGMHALPGLPELERRVHALSHGAR